MFTPRFDVRRREKRIPLPKLRPIVEPVTAAAASLDRPV
jgi:hypothetical protein